jgi:hypothetical protein
LLRFIALAAILFACVPEGIRYPNPTDSGPRDAEVDAGTDAAVDAGSDAGSDAGVDSGADTGTDAGSEDTGVEDDAGQMDAAQPDGGGPRIWVGVGGNGRRVTSVDGVTWSNEQTFGGADDSNLFRSVGYGAGTFVALGGGLNGLLYWSADGVAWNDVGDNVGWFGGVAYGNGIFLAVGANGRYLTSNNGRNWGSGDVDFMQHFRAVAFGNGEFVLVGEEGRRTSTTDGSSFTTNVLGGDRLTGVVFTGDRFVAVGLNGRRVVSLDGENWMFDQTASDGLGFFDVAFGEGVVIAVGGSGTVYSTDGGQTWSQDRNAPLMNAITYGNGIFVGTGDFNGISFTSDDGFSWTQHNNAGPAGFFTKIVYGE